MKTAIYIEDGTVQLVFTPEGEFEKNALATFRDKPLEAKLFAGSFYDCRGGWIRQATYYMSSYGDREREDQSLILRIDNKRQVEPSPHTIKEAAAWAIVNGETP